MKRGELVQARLGDPASTGAAASVLCAVVSPDELNEHLATVLVAPVSGRAQPAPFRVPFTHSGKRAQILLEQTTSVQKTDVVQHVGALSPKTMAVVLQVLQALFSR